MPLSRIFDVANMSFNAFAKISEFTVSIELRVNRSRINKLTLFFMNITGPCSAVGNVSGNRCESDCRSKGREFDPVPFPYFPGD